MFDNLFTTLNLCLSLKTSGILCTATIRSNRIHKCSLSTDKELKKHGRGSSSVMKDKNSDLVLVKWFDNKCIHLVLTFSSPQSLTSIKRWDGEKKAYINIMCPETVKDYNEAMGGVDLADMLIPLYRTNIKSKRWYLKIIFHCIDICKVNGLLLYRRFADQTNLPKKKQNKLLKFTIDIACGLTMSNKVSSTRPVGRPSKSLEHEPPSKRGCKASVPIPISDVRYDLLNH